jgi:hypothetical protein
MKNYKTLLLALLTLPFIGFAQEEEVTEVKEKEKLARPTFESSAVIDNPSSTLYNKGTFEVVLQHRFGLVNSQAGNDLVGFWGNSNIRIAVAYSPIDRISVGFGTTKDKRLQDFNLKGAILQQTRSNSTPLSVTYYGNATISALPEENFNMVQDRYSFFNQIIVARRFSDNFSLQFAASLSHINAVPPTMKNDVFGIAFGAKFKITPGTNILIDYSQPLVSYDDPPTPNPLFAVKTPKPGISLGVEFNTSAHAFQIFATNYWGIVPQENYVYNQNDFFKGDILIGFNITRLYNF